ncbi:MAG: hypothetical protein WC503_02630 [Candidatus Shapirobacteria bacterium]
MDNNLDPAVDLKSEQTFLQEEKIDQLPEIVEEEIPPEEKRGILLYVLGTGVGILIIVGVIVLSVLYFLGLGK